MPQTAQADDRPLILIVDDDPEFRGTAAALFRHLGFAVSGAGSSAEALRAIEREMPALMLLDVYMPDMDGLELLSALRKAAIHAPVVVTSGAMSSAGADPLASAAINLGAEGTIRKPFGLSEAKAIVESVAPAIAATAARALL